jgi:hypothetical protein
VAGSKSLGDKWADTTTAHGRLMQHGTQGRGACLSSRRSNMGRGLLLWLIGIPIPIILLIWLFGGLS